MKKVLLLGSHGMLGTQFMRDFDKKKWDIIGYDRSNSNNSIDITDKQAITELIFSLKPNMIINCAAYTNVDGAETDTEMATNINAEGVNYIAQAAQKNGAVLIHFSTDYVFNGQLPKGYREDNTDFEPQNVYGITKLKGEQYIQDIMSDYYIIRTSWLFGQYGNNFVETMLTLATQKDSLQIVDDQVGNPTYTKDLVAAVISLIQKQYPFGIYHLTNSTPDHKGISWYQFTKTIFELNNIAIPVYSTSSEQFKRPAKRPAYSTLLNTKVPDLRSYREALKDYLAIKKT